MWKILRAPSKKYERSALRLSLLRQTRSCALIEENYWNSRKRTSSRRCMGRSIFVDAGGLMSYAPNTIDLYRRAATYVDKILEGAKPANLTIEQSTKFEFIINLKADKHIGLTIPPNV